MIPFFKPGMRAYVLAGVALVSALLLQANAQGVLAMAPMLKLTLAFILTVVAPLLPVYIRKAIAAIEERNLSGQDKPRVAA